MSPTTIRFVAGIGLQQPRHWYHVGRVVHAAAELSLFRPQRTLLLGNDLTGAGELVGLVDAAGSEVLAATQAVRSAQAGLSSGDRLIVELPGVRDADGRSPFWLGLGRHFCPTSPEEAERRHGAAWQGHVAALLPRQLVYASFLPEAAQQAIGRRAQAARAAEQLLLDAGFAWQGHINIADGGPVLEWVVR